MLFARNGGAQTILFFKAMSPDSNPDHGSPDELQATSPHRAREGRTKRGGRLGWRLHLCCWERSDSQLCLLSSVYTHYFSKLQGRGVTSLLCPRWKGCLALLTVTLQTALHIKSGLQSQASIHYQEFLWLQWGQGLHPARLLDTYLSTYIWVS